MLTLEQGSLAFAETEVKRSRFLAHIARTDNEDAARQMINEIQKTYPDARHHCNAYIVQIQGANPVHHSSDDGEPAGTAGTPMLNALRHSGLENVTAVVTRYFGGTLLGTGGLVRAYSQAVKSALEKASLVEVQELTRFRVTIPLSLAGKVEAELRGSGWQVVGIEWGNDVPIDIAAPASKQESLASQIATLTQSKATIHQVGIIRTEVDSHVHLS